MDAQQAVEMLMELVDKLGIECRVAPLGGSGGGLCVLRGKSVLFVDAEADAAEQAHAIAAALADRDDLDEHFIVPQLRQFIEQSRREHR